MFYINFSTQVLTTDGNIIACKWLFKKYWETNQAISENVTKR